MVTDVSSLTNGDRGELLSVVSVVDERLPSVVNRPFKQGQMIVATPVKPHPTCRVNIPFNLPESTVTYESLRYVKSSNHSAGHTAAVCNRGIIINIWV